MSRSVEEAGLGSMTAERNPPQVIEGLFFAVAVFTVIGRLITRIYTRRRLYLDDAFLVFGLLCLCGTTV